VAGGVFWLGWVLDAGWLWLVVWTGRGGYPADADVRSGASAPLSLAPGPDLKGRIPAIVATLATNGWDRIGFNGRQFGLAR
jgi:hypothetical protein